MAREMKDSGIQWIGEIPKHWNKTTIKNGCDLLSSGTTPASGHEEYYINGTINWIQSGDLYNNPIISSVSKRITQKAFDNTPSLKVYIAPFIVVAMYGASVGNVSISEIDACCNQACCCIKANEKLSLKFLMYWLLSCKKDFLVKASGGGQPNISQQIIQNEVLLIPSKEEQQRIASFLDSKCAEIDKAIEATKASIEEYRKLRQAIITEAVTKGLNPDVEMKDSGIEWIGEIPRHWDVIRMKYVGQTRNGLTYKPNDVTDESGTLVLRSSNIQEGKLSLNDNVYVSCSIPDSLFVTPGDILICSRNGSKSLIGKNALIEQSINAAFGAFMMIFRTRHNNKYLYYLLNSSVFSYYLGSYLTTTINQLTGSNFEEMKIPFSPDPSEQMSISIFLDTKCSEIDSLIKSKEKLIEELTAYRKSLIYEYVTGKKEVPTV